MRAVLSVVLAACALAPVCGCASTEAVSVDEAVKATPRPAQPTSLRVALAPVEVDPAAALAPASDKEHWSPVPVDPAAMKQAIHAAAAGSGAFRTESAVLALETRGTEAPATAPAGYAFGVPAAAPLDKTFDEAFDKNADLVLTLRVRKNSVRYVERNSWYVPNLFNFFFNIWPAWFVADERYGGDVEVDAMLRGVGSEKVVWKKSYAATVEKDVRELDRGWMFLGTLTVPGYLDLENYVQAGSMVLPHARNEIARQVAADLSKLSKDMESGAIATGLGHTLGVFVGVGRYKSIPDLLPSSDDARKLSQAMITTGAMPTRNAVVLIEGGATRDKVLAAVRERARRATPRETMLFYFAGFGFTANGDGWLATNDFDPKRPTATSISFSELAGALASGKGRPVVILDTQLSGDLVKGEKLRTVPPLYLAQTASAGMPLQAREEEARAALDKLARAATVLVAAMPGTSATELSPIPEDKAGLLSAQLIAATETLEADASKDGAVTLAEAFEVAKVEVPRVSAGAGLPQTPGLLGAPARAKELVIARPRKKS
jgi:hypothetical protein